MKLFLLIFLIIPAACYSQQGFYLGAQVNNGFYWLYNKDDFKQTEIETMAPNAFQFNNFKTGISTGFGISGKSALNFNLNYNHFIQNYRESTGTINFVPQYYNFYSKLSYTSFFSSFEFDFTDAYEHSAIPFINVGAHISYLIGYNEYGSESSEAPNYYSSINKNDNGIISYRHYNKDSLDFAFDGKSDIIYHRIVWGGNLSLGIKVPVSEHFNINIELSGSYDFNNTDNLDANLYSADTLMHKYWRYLYKFPSGDFAYRKPSHNIYAGLGVTVNYYFRSRYDY